MARLSSLRDLFLDELKDVYSAEKQIMTALPKMAKATQNPQLQQAFEEHLQQTRTQKDRLEQIFEMLGTNAGRKKCVGMEGILSEGQEFMESKPEPDVLDAGLIASAQKVEHYEMATYGTLRTFARVLGNQQAAGLLQQTLDEEGATDKKLTMLAEHGANQEANR